MVFPCFLGATWYAAFSKHGTVSETAEPPNTWAFGKELLAPHRNQGGSVGFSSPFSGVSAVQVFAFQAPKAKRFGAN